MERGQGGRDNFFGFNDPFAGFGNFQRPRSLFANVFGGRDPFDDPFFTQPYGTLMGPSMFGPRFFGPNLTPYGDSFNNTGFIEQAPPPHGNNSRGPIIREIDDDEHGEIERNNGEPHVQEPDEETQENTSEYVQQRPQFATGNGGNGGQSQARSYTFQSSSVTYGGVNGNYYTSSTSRRTGSDGITMEESKEADTTTGRATHKISRGIRDKGHSVTRKLNSDGRVDTNQTLHNLHQDELAGFEEAWNGNAGQYLPNFDSLNGANNGGGSGRRAQQANMGWALPSTEQNRNSGKSGSSRSRVIPIS